MNTFYRGDDGRIHSLGENNEIRHWKYIKKIPVGKGFRYFYSWDEYRAYLADPTVELQKTGQKAANQLQSAGRQAGKDVRSAGRSAQKQISKGRNKVERAIKTADRSKMTVSGAKQANASKPESTRKRLNDLAKKVSQKWNSGKEAVKETAENGKKWVEKVVKLPGKKIKEWEEERERRKKEKERKEREKKEKERQEREEKREKLAKKYKYIKRVKINGEYKYFYSQDEIAAYERRKDYMANEPDFMKDVKHSESPYTSEEDAIQVNPNHNLHDLDSRYEYNCAECTAIYELRRRGYDVESNGESAIGKNSEKYNTEKRFDLFYEDAEINHFKPVKSDSEAKKQIESQFDEMPPGSRGDISFVWKEGGGHSVAWEKDSNGKVHIYDTQLSGHGNRIEYDMDEFVSAIDNTSGYYGQGKGVTKFKKTSGTTITRTDNLELKPEIKKICKDTNDKKRKKPNASKAWELHMDENGGRIHERMMEEEELTKKYSNLT